MAIRVQCSICSNFYTTQGIKNHKKTHMVLSKITDFCLSTIISVAVLGFVLGVLSFNKDQTYGIKTLGTIGKASYTAGYVICEFTGLCFEGDTISEKVGSFIRGAMTEFNKAKNDADVQLEKTKHQKLAIELQNIINRRKKQRNHTKMFNQTFQTNQENRTYFTSETPNSNTNGNTDENNQDNKQDNVNSDSSSVVDIKYLFYDSHSYLRYLTKGGDYKYFEYFPNELSVEIYMPREFQSDIIWHNTNSSAYRSYMKNKQEHLFENGFIDDE